MKHYTLGISLGGKVEFVLCVLAEDFSHAVKEWAFLTGHLDPLLDMNTFTYFGWPIVETTEVPLERRKSEIKL